MKSINHIILLAVLAFGISSCTNKKSAERRAANELKQYVDSMESTDLDPTEDGWIMIDNGYQERALRAEAELESMSEEDKTELELAKSKYAELSARYDMELKRKNTIINSKTTLRNSLFGEGKIGEDMTFSFANSSNLLSIYQTFIDAIDANRKSYSREDWDEIKLLYEALDTRKNEVEKSLPSGDNGKIALLKVKFATIYDTNRPGSKTRENAEAKE